VLGDIGPFGGIMEPYGEISESDVRAALQEQADALVEGGVDAIIIETQTALEELAIGIEASKKAGAPAVIASLAYDVMVNRRDMKTMMGISPEKAAAFAKEAGADVIALNCGTGIDMEWAGKCVAIYHACCDLPTMAQPNGGQPILQGDKVYYNQTPDEMAKQVHLALEAGVNIIGACCGSTPEHIRRLRPIVDDFNRRRAGRIA
jgi:5-methyltetrahydrofolate--homocysteine methyltransferase